MNALHIFDVSPAVYIGSTGNSKQYYGYPVGGIHYLLNYLSVAIMQRDYLVLCFDSPSLRKQHFSGYKAGRERRPEVFSQLEALYEGLQSCGIRCEKHPGYEADDIIEWATAENYQKYLGGTTIYSNDYDNCHSIRMGVTFYALLSSMNNINAGNFSTAIYKGIDIPYNTISAYKVFTGCSGDKIPALKIKKGVSGQQLYRIWLQVMQRIGNISDRAIGTNPKLIVSFAKSTGWFDEEDMLNLQKQIDLVFPAPKPSNIVITPTSSSEIDMDAYAQLCAMYGATDALRCVRMSNVKATPERINLVKEKAQALRTGAYAADHDLLHDSRSVCSTLLDLSAFSREY